MNKLCLERMNNLKEKFQQTKFNVPKEKQFVITKKKRYREQIASENLSNSSVERYRSVTIEELAQMWKRSKIIAVKPSTILKYEEIVERHINPILGGYTASQIDVETIRDFILYKQKEGRLDDKGSLSDSYVRTIVIVLKSILEFGSHGNYCPALSLRRMVPPVSNTPPKTLSLTEQKQLENYLTAHLCPTSISILLGLRAGLRIGEVCALNKDDINLENKVISVRHTIVRVRGSENHTAYRLDVPKTKTSARDIPIADVLYQSLSIAEKEEYGQYVASGSDRFIVPPTLEYRYHRMLEAAGIPCINFHSLRHTFATRCIEAGMDDKSLSEILGHSNVSITLNTYVHSSMALKRAQMERFCKMIADENIYPL